MKYVVMIVCLITAMNAKGQTGVAAYVCDPPKNDCDTKVVISFTDSITYISVNENKYEIPDKDMRAIYYLLKNHFTSYNTEQKWYNRKRLPVID